VRVVEGAWPGSVVLMEFPRLAHAERWYRSPEYQRILHLRTNNGVSDLVFVESLPPGLSPAALTRQIRATANPMLQEE
jgi:uncharacterized protein (DUF1330 family)